MSQSHCYTIGYTLDAPPLCPEAHATAILLGLDQMLFEDLNFTL